MMANLGYPKDLARELARYQQAKQQITSLPELGGVGDVVLGFPSALERELSRVRRAKGLEATPWKAGQPSGEASWFVPQMTKQGCPPGFKAMAGKGGMPRCEPDRSISPSLKPPLPALTPPDGEVMTMQLPTATQVVQAAQAAVAPPAAPMTTTTKVLIGGGVVLGVGLLYLALK